MDLNNKTDVEKFIFDFVEKYYLEEHRFYHTEKHITFMINKLDNINISLSNRFIIYLAILFHDIVYNPKDNDKNNVINSSNLFLKWYEENKFIVEKYMSLISCEIELNLLKDIVNNLILSTIGHQPNVFFGNKSELEDIVYTFLDLDLMILSTNEFEYENYAKNILKEYSHYDRLTLLNGRLDFLKTMLKKENIFYKFKNLNNKAIDNIEMEIKNLNLELDKYKTNTLKNFFEC